MKRCNLNFLTNFALNHKFTILCTNIRHIYIARHGKNCVAIMEQILSELGVVEETESKLERDVLLAKIRDSIVFEKNTFLVTNIPKAAGIPKLLEPSLRSIQSRVTESLRFDNSLKGVLKSAFLRKLNENTRKSNTINSIIGDADYSNAVKIQNDESVPGKVKLIDTMHIPVQTRRFCETKSNIPRMDLKELNYLNKEAKITRSTKRTLTADQPPVMKLVEYVSDSFSCPICEELISNTSIELFNKHVDRCSRRKRPTRSAGPDTEMENGKISSTSLMAGDEELFCDIDDFDAPESDDDNLLEVGMKRKQRLVKASSKSLKTSRKRVSNGSLSTQNDWSGISDVPNELEFEEETQRILDEQQGYDETLTATATAVNDDWEDAAYMSRLETVPPEELEVLEVEEEGLLVNKKSWVKLYEYQREGCKWLFDLYQSGTGGILGLGKTGQVCTHFGTLARLARTQAAAEAEAAEIAEPAPRRNKTMCRAFLVVCPATVLLHWLQEMHHWDPEMRTVMLHHISATGSGVSKLGDDGIELAVRKLRRNPRTRGLVVITTYEGLRKFRSSLTMIEWTAICLDEGQKIRNPTTEIAVVAKTLPAYHRIILSGTPIQNSLRELWSLFDFIYPGRLGTLSVFEAEFALPIRLGGYTNASKLQYEIAIRCAITLQKIVKPYLLRRKKEDLIAVTKLPPKTEQVLFCQISSKQREIYMEILSSNEVQAVLSQRIAAFRAINTLRKLCNHPFLVYQNGRIVWQQEENIQKSIRNAQNGSNKNTINTARKRVSDGNDADLIENSLDVEEDDEDEYGFFSSSCSLSSSGIVWADSGKLLVLSKVLPLWHSEGHKVLLFCQTRAMLSVIESMVQELQFQYLRMDGATPVSKRGSIIHEFNHNPKTFIILLTTRTGGVGISLTAANRVILFDPDWNPMIDVQSRERAWRLGQQREVTIYRLITKGTIEEKIYQRQIYKLLLSNRILDNAKQKSLFSKTNLRELFELTDDISITSSAPHRYNNNAHVSHDRFHTSLRRDDTIDENLELPKDGIVSLYDEGREDGPRQLSSAQSKFLQQQQTQQGQHENAFVDAALRVPTLIAADGSSHSWKGNDESPPLYTVQPYAPESLPPEVDAAIKDSFLPDNVDNSGSNERDRRLLRVLFEGEAITTVYDHEYVDPSSSASASVKKSKNAAVLERSRIQEKAIEIVDKAVQHLQSSHSVYRQQGEHAQEGSSGNSSSARAQVSTAASTAVKAVNKFTASSATGDPSRSSAALLAALRGNKAAVSAAATAKRPLSNPFASPTPSGLPNSISNVADPPQQHNQGSGSGSKQSIRQDIKQRLQTLLGPPHYPKLTTTFILTRFKDLGDQYAPMFREILREVGVMHEGCWILKRP